MVVLPKFLHVEQPQIEPLGHAFRRSSIQISTT